MNATATAMQQEEIVLTAQEKWAVSDKFTRERMLREIGWPICFATEPWRKLKHMIQVNLALKKWTK